VPARTSHPAAGTARYLLHLLFGADGPSSFPFMQEATSASHGTAFSVKLLLLLGRRTLRRNRKGSMKRLVATAVAAALVGLGGYAGPVDAAPKSVARSAVAFWDVGDALTTQVSLQPTDAKTHLEQGKPERSRSVFLFVTQEFCDTGADQLVFRSFSSLSSIRPNQLQVQPNFKRARLDATVTLAGSEQRIDDCSDPEGQGTTTSFDTVATITASWQATGPITEAGPGFFTRDAAATGTLTSPSSAGIGSLGAAEFASLTQFTS
jgi:hypothetical protein